MDLFYFVFFFAMLSCLCLAALCGHLLGKGWPLGSPVCDVFLCICYFSHMVSWVGCGA